MKHFFTIIVIFFFSNQMFAQNTNRINFFYGFAYNELIRSANLDGAPSYKGKGATIIGVTYQRTIYKSLSLETGLEYSENKIEITPVYYPENHMYPSKNAATQKVSVNMITIPVYANYTFFKYFYANAGVLIDFEINRGDYPKTSDQSGIGFGAGIGGQYTLQNFTLFVNPMIRFHAVIANEKEKYHQHITESGIKIGIAYNF